MLYSCRIMLGYESYADEKLVVLLKAGDDLAYTEIYNRYKGPLYLFVYKRLRDREKSKDLVHDFFLRLWSNHAEIAIRSSLAVYLFTSVRNRMLDLIAHQQVQSRYIDSFQAYLNQENNDTDHLVRRKDLQHIIQQEIDALPQKMKLVFQLSRESELSRKEIAEQLGLSEQTVKSHMHQALRILKTRLGAMFFLLFFFID